MRMIWRHVVNIAARVHVARVHVALAAVLCERIMLIVKKIQHRVANAPCHRHMKLYYCLPGTALPLLCLCCPLEFFAHFATSLPMFFQWTDRVR